MIRALRALDSVLGRAAEVLTGAAVLTQTAVVLAQAICRYALDRPLAWGDEMARYLLIFMSFMGGYAALRRGALARVDLLGEKLRGNAARVVALLVCAVSLVLLGVVVYYGAELVASPAIVQQRSPAMRLPMYWVYGVVPLSAAGMIVHLLLVFVRTVFPKGG